MVAAAELGCNGMTINWPDWLLEYVGQVQDAAPQSPLAN
jgi:glycerophosphoryl diester phosphodiesterase